MINLASQLCAPLVVVLLLLSPITALYGQESSEPFDMPVVTNGPRPLQSEALAARATQALEGSMPEGLEEYVSVARISSESVPEIYILYELGWVKFVEKVRARQPIDLSSSGAPQLVAEEVRSKISFDPLGKTVISQELAATALEACHPLLKPIIKPPTPPFFNNGKGIIWNNKTNYLALEAWAILDMAANRCARGILDLRTAEVACVPLLPCFTE